MACYTIAVANYYTTAVRHSTHREYVFFATTRIFCFEAGLLARRERGRKGASEATIRRTLGTQRERNTKRTNFSHHRHFNAQNTFTHTPRQKKVRFSFRARAIVSIARIRARIRDDAFASVVLDPAHYSRGAVSLFLSFFCGLSASSFLNLRCHDARVKEEEEEENRTRERERKKRKRRPEFGNKTDDSPRDARDSSARRTIFGSRALPLSLLR